MVYKKIQIVYGLIVTKKELYQLIEELENQKLDLIEDFYDLRDLEGIPIHRFPACSCTESANNDLFVLGEIIDTIWRRKSTCTLCEIYSACDRCIGMTESGFYPVETIYEKLVECPIENICPRCFRANPGKLTIENKYAGKFQKRLCVRCNYESYRIAQFKFNESSDNSYIIERLEQIRNSSTQITEKAYFMLDDCLSCT